METHIFTVYDNAAQRYLDPFTAPTIEFALREFRRLVNTAGHNFNVYPDDYTLFLIGQFDPHTGTIDPAHPQSLGVAITMIEHPKPFLQEENNDA
jgi:hypothetical protein